MMKGNIIANFIGRAWGVVSVYLFIPLYLKFLGIEAYGLVGFYSALIGVLAFADMGFSATLNREMARLSVRKDATGEMSDLLRTYETTYLFVSVLLSLLIWFISPLIAERWLRSEVLQHHEVAAALRLMGIAVAFQLQSGLYIGGLMGLQKQVLTNSLQILWSLFRGLGAVLVLWLFSPTIFAFSFWQLISNAAYCYTARLLLWHALSPGILRPRFKWAAFRNTWRYAAGMTGMAVITTLLTQTDKLVVSKMMSLQIFGYYTLAATLAMVPVMLASPIASAVFPRLTGLVAMEDRDALIALYHRACELVAVAIIPGGLTLALFAGDFIRAWTGSAVAAQRAGQVAALLLGGQLLQAIAVIPYYVALAHGNVRLYLYIGIVSVILVTPLLIILVRNSGVVGAGLSWLVMNLCTMPAAVGILHRRFLPGQLQQWCLRDVGVPLLAAVPWVLLGRCLIPHTSSRFLSFCLIGLVWGVSASASASTIPHLRRSFMKKTRDIFRASYET